MSRVIHNSSGDDLVSLNELYLIILGGACPLE